MEYNIRTALMIISAIAILAILLHGLWKIRKNKNPYKLKAKISKGEQITKLTRNFDGSGFDQDGVGQPRIIGTNAFTGEIENPPEEHEIPHQPAPAPEFNIDPIPKDVIEKELALADEPDMSITQAVKEFDVPQYAEKPKTVAPEPKPMAKPVYEAPVKNPKPESIHRAQNTTPRPKINRSVSQIEINFGDELRFEDDEEPSFNVKPKERIKKPIAPVEIDPEVIVLSVIMPENQVMSGAVLLPTLLTLGMKFGDMNIFHRHQDNAGNGKVTFSVANMMNPGTFDLDTMETFVTQGVSLFMTLPNPGDAFIVFDQMLAAAKQIAQEFKGQLLDDKRSVMTKQTEQHYISRIREFDRKYRIAAN